MGARAEGRILALLLLLSALLAFWGYRYYERMRLSLPAFLDLGAEPAEEPLSGPRTEVTLLYGAPDGERLATETRSVPEAAGTVEKCRLVIVELSRAPSGGLLPLVPPHFAVRAIFLAEGLLVVDLEPKIREWAPGVTQEALMWQSVAGSVILNAAGVRAVRFLVGGREETAPLGHVGLAAEFAAAGPPHP